MNTDVSTERASEDEMDEPTRKVEHAKPVEHERIWLSPSCESPERTWCQDAVFEVCECGAGPVEYIRADLVSDSRKHIAADLAGLLRVLGDCATISDRMVHAGISYTVGKVMGEAKSAIERLLRERDEARDMLEIARDQRLVAEHIALKESELVKAAMRKRDDLMRRLRGEVGDV